MSEHDISGSGGKGGGGSAFFEADDTLKSTAVVRVVEVISEGEIIGVVDGKKGVYLNNVPVMNADGTENFGGNVAFQERIGLPDQPPMSGFPAATAEFSIGTQVTNAGGGVIYTTLSDSPRIDALRVTIGLNDGLAFNDTSSNQLKGTSVELAIERRLGAGTWTEVKRFEIRGKATSAYEESHRIERPLGTGTWSVRVKRITADNSSATLKNNTFLVRVAEIQDVTKIYENTAYVGLAVDARSVASSSVPTRSYLTKGIKVKIPSNYTVATRSYSGQWNGLFKTAMEWTDNPAWILYDFLCHPRYGLGAWVTEDLVDKYSFYNAAVYCDELVNKYDQDGNLEGTEPRFTFNYQIMARQDANKWLQDIAGMMNAKLVWLGNKATLVQDRPASVVRLITNSNVVDGKFSYKSTSQQDRITAVLVTWNNPEGQYQQETVTVDKNTTHGSLSTLIANAEAKYGYNSEEIVALGCTSEYQARRAGAWKLDTALSQTEIVNFKMFINGYDLFPGEIISLFDQDYAGVQLAGKLLSGATTTSLPLDRSVTISAGATISVMLPNGTIETKNVTQGAGTYSTLTASTALSAAPNEYADFIVTSAISPRQFRVTKTTLDQEGFVQLEAVLHDPNKYSRVETGTNSAESVYSAIGPITLAPPTALLFKEVSVNIDNTIVRSLNVSWQRPVDGIVSYYTLQWQVDSGGWQSMSCLMASADLPNLLPGLYEFRVAAVGVNGIASPELRGSYSISVTGGGASPLSPVTNLVAVPSGTTSFAGTALTVKWTNPAGNASITSTTIRDFEVVVLTTGDVALRTTFIPPVYPSQDQNYTYDLDANLADGGPRRTFKVRVRIRDANNNFSTATVATFANAAPAAPGLTVSSGFQTNIVKWNKPADTDYAGTLLWASTTSGFVPAIGNLIFEGNLTSFGHTNLNDNETWYYKAAHYDDFSKDYSGTGLNVSTQGTGTTTAGVTVNEWELNGVTWTPNSPGANQLSWSACTSIKTLGSGAGGTTAISAGSATWSSGILYIYHEAGQATLSSTTTLATALANTNRYIVATYRGGTNLEVGNGRAYMDGGLLIAGTVGATQVTTGELITSSAQIRNATIVDAHITGTINANKIDANQLSAITADLGAITAGSIDIGAGKFQVSSSGYLVAKGVQILDESNNVVLSTKTGSSANLPSSWVTPASGWLNSNVSISSNGALSGAGGGQVTIGGLGYTGDLNATRDLVLIAGTYMTVTGNSAYKTGGTGGWESHVYSKDGYVNGAYAMGAPAQTDKALMFGLNADPTANQSYDSIDAAIYLTSGGVCEIYEGGVARGTFGGYAVGDVFAVHYDGVNVRYYKNGSLLRTVAWQTTSPLYFDSSFANSGARLDGIRFGPLSSSNWADINKPSSAASNVIIDFGLDPGVSLNSSYSAIVADTTATGGQCLKLWLGWDVIIYLNKSTNDQAYKFVQGKRYKVFIRIKKVGNPWSLTYGGYGASSGTVWSSSLSNTLVTTSWQVLPLEDLVPNWNSGHDVYTYFGQDPMGDSTSNYYLIDWLYFQPVNAEEGATVGANAANFTGSVGGDNLIGNSSFELKADSGDRAVGWVEYAPNIGTDTYFRVTGRTGGYAFALRAINVASAGSSWAFGLQGTADSGPPYQDPRVLGGWQPYRTYVVSWWAKRTGSSNWGGMHMNWNTQPTAVVTLLNPTLTTSWQRYAYRVTWGASAEVNGNIYITVDSPTNTLVNSEIHIDDLQVEEGDVLTAWKDSFRDVVGYGRKIGSGNASVFIADAAIGTAQIGTLTAANLTVTALSNTVNGSASSGARVVIATNAIEVYNSSNALRVRISS